MDATRLAGVLAGAALLTGCGGTPAAGDVVPADVVMFEILDGTPMVAHSVLDDPDDVDGFAGRLAAHDEDDAEVFRERVDGRDLGTTELVAFVSSLGCDSASGVELRRSGDDVDFRYLGRTDVEECAELKSTAVVFALPKDRLPPGVTLLGAPPQPAGLGELVAFEEVEGGPPDVAAAEVTRPDQTERFLAQFPDGLSAVAGALDPPPGGRLFAFPLNGCPGEEGAVLVVEAEQQLSAAPARGEDVRCAAVTRYVAVFGVGAGEVPPAVRVAS